MPYTQLTVATLQARLAARWEGTPFWTPTDALDALNEACRVWNALTGYWRRRIVVEGPPGDPFLPVPGTLTHAAALTWQGIPITGPVGLATLGKLAPRWRSDTTAQASDPPQVWARVGLGLIVVWPAPIAGGSFEVDGIRQTPTLSAPTDTLDMEEALLELLLGEALHVASFTAGGALLQRTYPLHQAFRRGAVALAAELAQARWAQVDRYRERQAEAAEAEAVPSDGLETP